MKTLTIGRISSILEEIYKKHRTACAFTAQKYYVDDTKYQTYIADDIFPCHRDAASADDALARLEEFLALDNLLAHKKELAENRLKTLKEDLENIEDQIKECEAHLKNKEI